MVVRRQQGHSYEMSIVLCSVLVGEGYDAFVCSGYATQDVTEYIRYRTPCPVQSNVPVEKIIVEEKKQMKYQLRPPRDFRSKFLLGLEQREFEKQEIKRIEDEERAQLEQEEYERAPEDPLYSWRVHAWVLLLPSRDVTTPVFIEPSTGEYHPLSTDIYTGIESIFSHENYWINMQDCTYGINNLSYDFSDLNCWEHLLIGEPFSKRISGLKPDEVVDHHPSEDERHLDIPEPWSEPIVIDHNIFTQRYPSGVKVTNYRVTGLYQFGDYMQPDGLKFRLKNYNDFECTELLTIDDNYENRKDRLIVTVTNAEKNELTEYFKIGREDACRTHTFCYGRNSLEMPREISFFSKYRLDGLKHIKTDAVFLNETFKNREDKLIARYTVFAVRGKPPPGMIEGVRRLILSITEIFERDYTKEPDKDVAERIFSIRDNEILLTYHYSEGHVTASTRTFIKPELVAAGEEIKYNPEFTFNYFSNLDTKTPKQLELYYLLQKLLKDEKTSIKAVRECENFLSNFIRTRSLECTVVQLDVSLYNRELNEDYKDGLKEKEAFEQEQETRELDEDMDCLIPYICRFASLSKPLTYHEATQAKTACIEEFKELLLNRGNKLQSLFAETYHKYQQRQLWFAKNVSKLSLEGEEEQLKILNEIKYLLNMYEIRLSRHRDISESRFQTLMDYLENDPRLAILNQGIFRN